MPLTEQEKEQVIAQALSTPEGREALAAAMILPINNAMEVFGISEEYLFDQGDERERAIRCLARYESNVAKGKVFDEGLIMGIHTVYDQWEIERGTALELLNPKIKEEIELLDPIESRFDILDL
jgi:hypothetical protein